ncbi:MAG: polyphosphate kinase [Pseudomonadota bacterium]|jgi:polyphosphate kinase
MLPAQTPPGEGLSKLPPQPTDGTLEPTLEAQRPSVRARAELRHPGFFLNRELTWLNFNHRVLNEAEDKRTPLLERVKFLAIVGSNLDEFHMKRVGGLKQQVGAELLELTVDGRTPRQQIEEARSAVREMTVKAEDIRAKLMRALTHRGVRLVPYASLRAPDQAWLRQHYIDNVFPLVTPQSIDPAHPFPFVSNLSLNLLVSVRAPNDENAVLSRIKLPIGGGIPRLVRVRDSLTFVALEEVIAHHLDLLFPDTTIESCELFRVTRNAIAEKDEEQADDLLEMIEAELRERKFAPVVRLEVSADMSRAHRDKLAHELELGDPDDVFEVDGMLALRDLMELAALPIPELHDRPHRPVDHPLLLDSTNIFQSIRDAGSLLVHHPYHSFSSSVERFLREASTDPRVRAVKMTLYRTSAETTIVDHLVEAARVGKQVTVVVELKARFDEEANIRWASRLENAGIHVTYGIVGLKTHTKITLVVRQDPAGLKRYVHIGTGNYHAGTARLYTDIGLFTCDDKIGRDATELFNFLTTGVTAHRRFSKLLLGPRMMKPALIEKIDREARHAQDRKPASIQMKMNALEDPDIVRALYRASQAGVQIDLIVRDTCRLRPGVPGLSDNVRVLSIVGRFLEHARVFCFHNGGDDEYFIGSADLMTRNLDSRVEVLVPIEPPELREELRNMLTMQLTDRRAAWEMRPDGSYVQRTAKATDRRKSSQELCIQQTQERVDRLIESKQGSKKRVRTRRSSLRRDAMRPARISAVPSSPPPSEPKPN